MRLTARPPLFSAKKSGAVKSFVKRDTPEEAMASPRRPTRTSYYVPATSRRLEAGNLGSGLLFKNAYSTPMRNFISRHQRRLVAQSREIILNNDYGRSFMRMMIQNVVGQNGIRFQAAARGKDNTLDTEVNEAVERAWAEWGSEQLCDVAQQEDFVGLQQDIITSLCTDGEFFVRMHTDTSSKYRLRLEVLDAQRCSPVETRAFQNNKAEVLYNGILFDGMSGKPVVYLFGEENNDNYYDDSSHRYDRIQANEIFHGFIKERIGQKRGLPPIHTALSRTNNLNLYEDAALLSAKVGASKAGFLTWNNDSAPPSVEELEGEIIMDPTTLTELPPGLGIDTWDPAYPHEQYETFVRSMLRAISTGMGVSYHDLANDLTDVNYSSIRQGALDVRENWKVLQQWFIRKFHNPLYRIWLPLQLRHGTIKTRSGRTLTLTDLENCLEVIWTGRRWDWIDPKSEAIANVERIRHLLASPSQVIRELGGDPQEVWSQIAEDIRAMENAGIPQELILDALSNQIQQFEVDSDNETTSNKTQGTAKKGKPIRT